MPQGVSGVGVLGRDGVLVGVVSARDVRAMIASAALFDLMHAPLRTFFEAVNRTRTDVMSPAIRCQAKVPRIPADLSLSLSLSNTHCFYLYVR